MTSFFTYWFRRRLPWIAELLGIAILSACTALSVPAPSRPDDRQTSAGQLFYVTDRKPESASPQRSRYGIKRSSSMAFGELRMVPGGGAPELAAHELIRFPRTPVPFSQQGGRIIPDPLGANAYRVQSAKFKSRIAAALRAAKTHDVILYVHGYRNDFEESVATARTLWLASGRIGVPIAFSWPAGNPGLFGYFKDSESGDFSIFHLKETLRLLADVPGLRNINVIAHSRGTGVATSALREMVIAARASGRDPRRVLKIDNLILAAPDLDFGVVSQRLIAEQFGPAFGRITVYMNPNDGTLALAQNVMSGIRFGRLKFGDLDKNERRIFSRIHNVDFIDVENVVRRSGHSYFRQNPAVLADITTLLRSSLPPGDPGRYLVSQGVNFWKATNPPSRKAVGTAENR